ncbi:UNKNOWN [Stylonychia lemnae]|uniref:Uncharacterized protein n=1 Tax=Stylonychia lemnae TaxID=5949 RepID=A0A077ZNF3_STYLE|nr:UNKNOWN [Stylonychia lemnae]|eukprot:CDW71507.1 UNKNOWN [Stylonychia lemnae]
MGSLTNNPYSAQRFLSTAASSRRAQQNSNQLNGLSVVSQIESHRRRSTKQSEQFDRIHHRSIEVVEIQPQQADITQRMIMTQQLKFRTRGERKQTQKNSIFNGKFTLLDNSETRMLPSISQFIQKKILPKQSNLLKEFISLSSRNNSIPNDYLIQLHTEIQKSNILNQTAVGPATTLRRPKKNKSSRINKTIIQEDNYVEQQKKTLMTIKSNNCSTLKHQTKDQSVGLGGTSGNNTDVNQTQISCKNSNEDFMGSKYDQNIHEKLALLNIQDSRELRNQLVYEQLAQGRFFQKKYHKSFSIQHNQDKINYNNVNPRIQTSNQTARLRIKSNYIQDQMNQDLNIFDQRFPLSSQQRFRIRNNPVLFHQSKEFQLKSEEKAKDQNTQQEEINEQLIPLEEIHQKSLLSTLRDSPDNSPTVQEKNIMSYKELDITLYDCNQISNPNLENSMNKQTSSTKGFVPHLQMKKKVLSKLNSSYKNEPYTTKSNKGINVLNSLRNSIDQKSNQQKFKDERYSSAMEGQSQIRLSQEGQIKPSIQIKASMKRKGSDFDCFLKKTEFNSIVINNFQMPCDSLIKKVNTPNRIKMKTREHKKIPYPMLKLNCYKRNLYRQNTGVTGVERANKTQGTFGNPLSNLNLTLAI